MLRAHRIIIIFSLLFFLASLGIVLADSADGAPLEVTYPQIGGEKPVTTSFPITNYIHYVFNFVLIVSGIIALGALIFGGFRYLTSTGKPEELNRAKKQMWAVFGGVLILLFSYLILNTINPELIKLQIPGLENILINPVVPNSQPPLPSTLLEKIKEITDKVKTSIEALNNLSEELKSQTDQCNCSTITSICLCSGGDPTAACQPTHCYSQAVSQPCSQGPEIKTKQQGIIALKNELLYYKYRTTEEIDDLIFEIGQLSSRISYYNTLIEKEREMYQQEMQSLSNPPSSSIGEANLQTRIASFQEKITELEKEKELKTELKEELATLSDLIAGVNYETLQMSDLVTRCETDIETKCQPVCKSGVSYGCHNRIDGCQPDKCSGGNPCPTEISGAVNKINDYYSQIISKLDNINGIAEETIIFETK